jgi:hypothetical protein
MAHFALGQEPWHCGTSGTQSQKEGQALPSHLPIQIPEFYVTDIPYEQTMLLLNNIS